MAYCLDFAVFVFSLYLLCVRVTLTQEFKVYEVNPAGADLVFDDDLLWTRSASSPVQCARHCNTDVSCVAFTSSSVIASEAVTCRGHSSSVTSGGVLMYGSTMYEEAQQGWNSVGSQQGSNPVGSQWLEKACASDSDCPVQDSVCFTDRCLCTPGYYYGQQANNCQLGCSALQDQFVQYPLRYITGHNLLVRVIDFQSCKDLCVTTATCVAVDYKYTVGKCFLSAVTPLDVPADWQVTSSNYSYFQRTCL